MLANPQPLMNPKEIIKFKKELITHCRNTQQQAVDTAKAEMNEAQQALNEYGPNKDRYDSFRDQLISRRDMISVQYQKALADMNVLEKIDPKVRKEKVEFGAVVITDTTNFVISISSKKIEIDHKVYYVISPAVPLFQAMHDLGKGDSFEFNGKKQTILDIF